MTYTPTKPSPGPSPYLDAPTIQTNFAQFASIFSTLSGGVNYNHMPMNDLNQGKHGAVILQQQSTLSGTVQGYTRLSALPQAAATGGTQPQIFGQIPKFLPTKLDTTDSPNNLMQLTCSNVNTSGPNQYQSFLVGGYLIYFGTTTNISVAITLSPTPTRIVLAIAEAQNNDTGGAPLPVSTNITSATQFSIYSGSLPGSYTFSWVAVAIQ